MATTGRPDAPAASASDVAAACREAGLVALVGAASGDSLAAVGLLGRALADAGVPYQARLISPAVDEPGTTDADCTVAVGRPDLGADHGVDATPEASLLDRADAIAAEFVESDPALGLAGALTANVDPPARFRENAEAAGIERRPGVAVPTADLADGLAHSTLVHAPFSGDREAAEEALADPDFPADPTDDDRRRVASLVALAVAEVEDCPPQATHAIERALHPAVGGPFETVGGYADVLDALARTDPGLGIAVALGRVDREAALAAWRDHGRAVHAAVGATDLSRHDGLASARVEVDPQTLESVARLLRDYRSPEPTVAVGGPEALVVATVDDAVDATAVLGDALARLDAVDEASAAVVGDSALGTAPVAVDHEAAVAAVRRAMG